MFKNIIKKIKQSAHLSVGGPVADSEVTICLYADEIDIEHITEQLGVNPTEGLKKGEIIGRRKPVSKGHWFLEAPNDLSFTEKIKFLLKKTTSDHSVWSSLSLNHEIQLRCSIYLHSWTEGFDLPATVVAEIGSRHWQFGLSVYSAEGEEIVDAFLADAVKKKTK